MGIFNKKFWQEVWSRGRLFFRPSGLGANELKDLALNNADFAITIFSKSITRRKLSPLQLLEIINHYEAVSAPNDVADAQRVLNFFPSSFSSAWLKDFAIQHADSANLALKIILNPQYRQNLSVDHLIEIINYHEKQLPQTLLVSLRNTLLLALANTPQLDVDYSDSNNLNTLKTLLVTTKILRQEDMASPALVDPAQAEYKLLHIMLVLRSTLSDQDFTPEQKVKMALKNVELAKIILYNPRINNNLKPEHFARIIKGYLKPAPAINAPSPSSSPVQARIRLDAPVSSFTLPVANPQPISELNSDSIRKEKFLKILKKNDLYDIAFYDPELAGLLIENGYISDPQQLVKLIFEMPVAFLEKHWNKVKTALTINNSPSNEALAEQARKDFFAELNGMVKFCKDFEEKNNTAVTTEQHLFYLKLVDEYVKIKQFIANTVALIHKENDPVLSPFLSADLRKYLKYANLRNEDEPLSEADVSSGSDRSSSNALSDHDSSSENELSNNRTGKPLVSVYIDPSNANGTKAAADLEKEKREQLLASKIEEVRQLLITLYNNDPDSDKKQETARHKKDQSSYDFKTKPEDHRTRDKRKQIFHDDLERVIKGFANVKKELGFSGKLQLLNLAAENHLALVALALGDEQSLASEQKNVSLTLRIFSEEERKQIATSLFSFSPHDFSIYLKWFGFNDLERLFVKYSHDQKIMLQMFAFLRRCREVTNINTVLYQQIAHNNINAAIELAIKNKAFASKIFSCIENTRILPGSNHIVATALILSKIHGPDFLKNHLETLVLAAMSNEQEMDAFVHAADPSLLTLFKDAYQDSDSPLAQSLKSHLSATLTTDTIKLKKLKGVSDHQALVTSLSKIASERSFPSVAAICVTDLKFKNGAWESRAKAATALKCTADQLNHALWVFPNQSHQNDMVRVLKENGVNESDYELTKVISPDQPEIDHDFLEQNRNKTLLLAPRPDKKIEQFGKFVERIKFSGNAIPDNIFKRAFNFALEKIEMVTELISRFGRINMENNDSSEAQQLPKSSTSVPTSPMMNLAHAPILRQG